MSKVSPTWGAFLIRRKKDRIEAAKWLEGQVRAVQGELGRERRIHYE